MIGSQSLKVQIGIGGSESGRMLSCLSLVERIAVFLSNNISKHSVAGCQMPWVSCLRYMEPDYAVSVPAIAVQSLQISAKPRSQD